MTNKVWVVEYCLSPIGKDTDPEKEETRNHVQDVRWAMHMMMMSAGLLDVWPSSINQYGSCLVFEYRFDLLKKDEKGNQLINEDVIKGLSPGGKWYEDMKKTCEEKGFYFITRTSRYAPE